MPGKIAHLVPMQRFDSIIVRRNVSMTKPSNTDYHSNTSTKSTAPPPMMITTAASIVATGKSSINDSSVLDGPSSLTSHYPLPKSTSIDSLKPSYEQSINGNSIDPENLLSQTRLQTMLSRFRQDLESTPIRFDIKRSSV